MTNEHAQTEHDPELEEMRPSKKPLWIAVAVIAALALTLTFAGPSLRAAFTPETSTSADGQAGYNDTDVHFLGMMVPHHQQAIDMSDVLLGSDVDDAKVRDLAQRIKDGQERENEQMRAWADEWGIEKDMEHHSTHIANGMFHPEQLEQFEALRGDELRTAFLEMMHFHHNHVIKMTQDEVDRGGYEPLREMAKEMIEVQTAEMGEMEELLGYTP
ncbi:hypothetical protein CAFEA_08835 [Corynebacterium afermentans subsp. afermentans]|uniref:Uncharacterized conserved protein, DUF305 family n=1 Tax=Corynebacterium afermentans TaxID=38286 RepID=A0A9X8R633_9CORY|nr:DUF305 domain-containing protein [Corynebacterium afermentans]WJY57347.1 hypothetical protein CAFEA_08835 [Corynebacterium afermentans subsp. afermentans]SIQ60051.1 Uncharacterized conserved protein, DUF305 family [Corynebacterium afermentans]